MNSTPDCSKLLGNIWCSRVSTSGSTPTMLMISAFSETRRSSFPIAWDRSKIPGFAGRVSVPNLHGFSALMVFSTVSARFFLPQVSGAGATPSAPSGVFRIDHDEKFNQTTHLQYQPWQRGPWIGFNWRYDSGLVAGAVPFATDANTPVDLTGLTADQQMQAGLFCGECVPHVDVTSHQLRTISVWLNARHDSGTWNRE